MKVLKETNHDATLRIGPFVPAIATGSNQKQREKALMLALMSFDHQDTKVHDEIVSAGVITVLMHCFERSALDHEHGFRDVEPLCKLVGMCLRCSVEVRKNAMKTIGSDLLLLLLSLMLDHSPKVSVETRSAVVLLLRQLPQSLPSLSELNRHMQLLRSLRQVIEDCDMKTDRHHIVEAIHLLSQISQDTENKNMIARFPGLCDSIVSRTSDSVRKRCELNMEVAFLFQQLAMDARNRSILANHTQLIELLILLMGDKRAETQLKSVGALKLLILEAHTRKIVLKSSKKKLLKALQKALEVRELRLDATQMITSMIISRKAAVELSNQSGLLKKFVAFSSQNEEADLARTASQTLKRIATHVPTDHENFGLLLDSIVQQAGSSDARVRYWACSAFLAQSLVPGSSFYLARDHHVVGILAKLGLDDTSPQVKAVAVEVIHKLASQEANIKRLALNPLILDALVNCAEQADDDDSDNNSIAQARRFAIQGILRLSSHRKYKRRLAKHFDLVKCLSTYAISHDEDKELKTAAIHGVLMLAPLM